MIITEKHKVKDLAQINVVLECSNVNLLDEVRKFEIPQANSPNDISMEDMIYIWAIKTQDDLFKLTAKCLLDKEEYMDEPLIDFLRLTLVITDTAKLAADMFATLKREPNDPDVKAISEMFSSSDFAIIDRFVKRSPVYTHEEAAKVSWLIYYECFKSDTQDYDMQEMINEKKKV